MNGKMVLIAGAVCTFMSTGVGLGYSNGTGTSDFPFEISSPAELVALGQTPDDYGKHFILTADLDLTGYLFDQAVIAPDTSADWGFQGAIFGGVFDGNGHVISHLTLLVPDEKDFIGLFGFSSGQIKNLGIQDAMIQGGWYVGYVGGLVGVQRYGAITSCWVSGSVSSAGNHIGGVVGFFDSWGTISDSFSTCTVNGGQYVGGLVGFDGGWVREVIITRCYATGDVSGTGYYVGGLVGEDSGTIISCYATGTVKGVSGVGGLVGSHSIFTGLISHSTATGSVHGTGSQVGGLIGGNEGGPIISCYATGTVDGASSVGGLAGQNSGSGTISASYANGSSSGGYQVGGLVGSNQGKIDSSHATGEVIGGQNVGGLVGDNTWGAIASCYATGTVSGTGQSIGGLVGYHHSNTITASFATGDVSGGDYVGGLVGLCDYPEGKGSIASCYAKGAVDGSHYVGGLIGLNGGIISSCYSIGTVSGNTNVGGLAGINQNKGTITSCFWDTQRSGNPTSAGGTGKNTSEMKTLTTFTAAGWDFVGEAANGTEDLWTIRDGTHYPWLTWQTLLTDWVGPDGVGLEDLLYLSERWMATTPEAAGAADANGDGKVDLADFAILASNWM